MTRMYWCTKCAAVVPKNTRQQRHDSKGWVCPTCNTGLPRTPMHMIEEETPLEEILLNALVTQSVRVPSF